MTTALEIIIGLKAKAREMDARLIAGGRAEIVGRKLGQIEGNGQVRKRVYVHRLAGKSNDIYRKSQTEREVEWLGATVFENPPLLDLTREFWLSVCAAAEGTLSSLAVRSFWTIDEEGGRLRGARRTAILCGDWQRVTELTLRLRRNEDEIAEQMRAGKLVTEEINGR